MTTHAHCTHPATAAARAKCRKGTPQPTAIEAGMSAFYANASAKATGRTDVHRPATFVPEDYDYDHAGTWSSDDFLAEVRKEAAAARARLHAEGWKIAGHQHTGQCGHCGARLMHYAAMKHIPSHTYIYIGETCLNGRFEMATAEFDQWRKMRAGNRARDAKAERIHNLLENHPLLRELPDAADMVSDDSFLFSIASQIQAKGELSEKQIAAAERSILKAKERDAAKKAKAEAMSGLAPMTAGRRLITGKIVSKKWMQNDFSYSGGSTAKIVIEDAEGYRYYGTLPSSVCDLDRGDEISLTATITPKGEDDPHFGFYKRPSL